MAQQTSEMIAGVTQLILDEWHDGLARSTPLWDMAVKGDGREKESGGLYLQFPIKLIANSTMGFIAGSGGNTGITPSIQEQYGILNWKYFYWSTNFTIADMTIANGEQDKIKILAKKLKGSMNDANRTMAQYTYLGSSTNALAFDGLADVGAASGTAYAGLTDTDYSDATAYLPYISTATVPTYATIADMTNVVRSRIQQSEYNPARVMGFMNSSVFSKFQAAVQNAQMFIDTKDMYSVGFQGFRVNNVEFYLDAYCQGTNTSGSTDNYIWIVPMDVFKFHYKFGFDASSPFDTNDLRIPDQPILSTQKFIAGNWVCTDRRLIAVCKTINL